MGGQAPLRPALICLNYGDLPRLLQQSSWVRVGRIGEFVDPARSESTVAE